MNCWVVGWPIGVWGATVTRDLEYCRRKILGNAKTFADLGRDFGAGLSEAEVRYLMRREWAVSAEDVLWRRSKLGLRLTVEQAEALGDFMSDLMASAA